MVTRQAATAALTDPVIPAIEIQKGLRTSVMFVLPSWPRRFFGSDHHPPR